MMHQVTNARAALAVNVISTMLASATLVLAPLAEKLPPDFLIWQGVVTALINIALNGYKVWSDGTQPA